MGDLVPLVSYAVASDTKTGKHTSNAEAFSRLHSEVGGPPVLQKTLAIFLSLQSSRLVQPCCRGQEETAQSSPKGFPCSTLHSRLPAREIKSPSKLGEEGSNRAQENTPFPPFCCCP